MGLVRLVLVLAMAFGLWHITTNPELAFFFGFLILWIALLVLFSWPRIHEDEVLDEAKAEAIQRPGGMPPG